MVRCYCYKYAKGTIHKDVDGARVVKQIFALRAKGLTMLAIADELNAQGLVTQRGKVWHGSSVRAVLLNEQKYKGGSMNGSQVTWPVLLSS